jgi:type IX secretion system PorP/SprF family membrane protein
MKYFLVVVLCWGFFQPLLSQTDGAVSLELPIRNSLKFNKFIINPAFSYVKEQAAFISIYNKRQWITFENAPQTYFVSYSGRFNPDNAIGLGLFQQNYGVLTNFGAIGNFSHNVVVNQDSNFTFGLNVGYFKTGINRSKVITNYSDPILETIPTNSYFVVNPGINYGIGLLDFGLSVSNLFMYNLKSTEFVKNNPGQTIELHLMHTGYLEFGGFLEQSRFTGFVKAELKKEKTILSAIAMLNVPKGFWAQIGYNTVFGVSGGIGANISPSILIEYNYERGLGNFINFGASHEITLAYKFKNNNSYYDEDEERALISPFENRRVAVAKPKEDKKIQTVAIQKPETKPEPEVKEVIKTEAVAIQEPIEEPKPEPKIAIEVPIEKILVEKKPVEEIKPNLDSIAKANRIAEQKVQAEAKILSDSIANVKLLAETKVKKDSIVPKVLPQSDGELNTIDNLALAASETKTKQKDLLSRLSVTIAKKEKDLLEMKLENDLSEKGIYSEPKTFRSTSTEKGELESLKVELTQVAQAQKDKISELENLYLEKVKKGNIQDESLLKNYSQTIKDLKQDYVIAVQSNEELNRSLDIIQEATEIEKKRRIKRASFINGEGRFAQDMETLQRIKQNTVVSSVPLKASDFDSGDDQPEIQIVKGVKNITNGYYVVIAVHADVTKRDEFLTKTVASGQNNVNFFYDANSSKYFIYYDSYESIDAAKQALKIKGSLPYNGKMSIVKIEN